jgi:hypothetical protein
MMPAAPTIIRATPGARRRDCCIRAADETSTCVRGTYDSPSRPDPVKGRSATGIGAGCEEMAMLVERSWIGVAGVPWACALPDGHYRSMKQPP